jgi:NTE family protein
MGRAEETGVTAFVFTGGGSLGAVQVGMLKALVAEGIRPAFVVGTSVGAINAAYFAGRPDAAGVERLDQLWRGLRRRDVFPLSPVTGVLGLLGRRDHLVEPGSLSTLLARGLPYRLLEEARIPCHVIASDLRDGAGVVLASGPVLEALRASTALPAVFPPVALDGRILIDGSVTNNLPLSTAIRLGATRVLVLPSGSPCALKRLPHHPVEIALHALSLLISNQLVQELQHQSGSSRLLVVPPLCPQATSPYDFSHSGVLIDRAYQSTREWLRNGGTERFLVPETLYPHHHAMPVSNLPGKGIEGAGV